MPEETLDLFQLSGDTISVGGNNTFWLDDPEVVWVVEAGQAELFAVPGNERTRTGRRFHLLSVLPGQALFGLDQEDLPAGLQLLVNGTPGTQVRKTPWEDFLALALNKATDQISGAVPHAAKVVPAENDYDLRSPSKPKRDTSTRTSHLEPRTSILIGLLENWLLQLTAAVVRKPVPKSFVRLEPTAEYQVDGARILSVSQGLLWVRLRQGSLTWLDDPANAILDGGFVPVTPGTWLEAVEASRLEIMTSQEFLVRNEQLNFRNYYLLLFKYWFALHAEAQKDEQARLIKKLTDQQGVMEESLLNLAAVSDMSRSASKGFDRETVDDPLWAACRLVGEAAKIDIRPLPPALRKNPARNPLDDIVKVSRIRTRQVVLKGEWWRADNGPLLAYLAEDECPVALLPVRPGAYKLYNPVQQTTIFVDSTVVSQIKPFAYAFYRTFPAHALQVKDLLQFAGKSKVRRDLLMILLMGIVGGLLNLATPIATGKLIDSIIPQAERGQLVQLTFILIVSILAVAMFELTRSVALIRMQGRLNADLQGAVWDRVINLPAPFFRQYSVGDLADRANSINTIRKILSGLTITAIIAGVFSSFNFFLLFAYDLKLALTALVLVLVMIAFTVAFGLLQMRKQRELAERGGKIQGLVLQLIRGIAKFGVAGAEKQAFALWARAFGDMRKVTWETARITNYLTTFNSAFPVLASLVLYAGAGTAVAGGLSTGSFLAFYSAFTSFIAATTATTAALIASSNVLPLYQRARPILETLPEIDEAKAMPGELSGDIEINHVYFRYAEDGPNILNNVSLNIKPGEFVAVVGSSGSGKSTLLRLLLGFEQAQSGTVYYDGQDLSQLDLPGVRRQLGVVLQNSQLMVGDIFSNIVGSKQFTLKDAEEAAHMVGLDEDIQQMPMGMYTLVSEGGSTLSGGQRQRLLIARAVVSKPRIIFFDEATSALDNRTQAIVSRSLEGLKATRVVIAHRLSTIINADRIFVLDQGKVVQTGNYQELIRQEGLFAQLAKRQLA
ncbi:MAG: NHLP bacteriocin export ABC transporter permease/ATPase subunit [Desulfitobacteriaceae bacterium]